MQRIAYFSNTDFSLYNFRLGLMREMKKRGFLVYACGSTTKKEYKKEIEKEFVFNSIPLKRGVDVFGGDVSYFLKVLSFCKKEKPDICHNFTVKPCIYATLAQSMAGVKEIYCTVTGSGYAFGKKGILKKIVVFLYKKSFKKATKVIFQNPEDKKEFVELGIIEEEKTEVIKGSGVNTEKFSLKNIDEEVRKKIKKEIDYNKEKIFVTLISRMLWQKGVKEFVEAAETLKKRHNNIEFLLVGPIDKENPSGIPEKEIEGWEDEEIIKYLGERKDVREILSLSHIFVLPSFYREGVPMILLEAGAMKLPLITADATGCKEAVENEKNGFLVEPKNSEDLTEKIEILINDKELREKFGEESRKIMEEEFSEEKVVKKTIRIYNLER